MKKKSDLRLYAKELRKTLDIKLISQKSVNLIRQSDIYKLAQNIMIYYPLKHEIDLRELFKDNKNFFLPKLNGENMDVCPLTDNLVKSNFNILEPCSSPVNPSILDLVIVPALMVDNLGYRLGYGGGFYDRFLKICSPKTMVILPKELFIEHLPHDEFDVPIDIVLLA